jgi:uracil-DNA glycosylase
LLLNTVLTVRAGEAFSHRGQGWEDFTESVVSALNRRSEPVVFMLWGAPAHKKEALITNTSHCVLKAAHPSPLSAHRGFFGCGHFSKANEFLSACGQTPVDWLMTDTSTALR